MKTEWLILESLKDTPGLEWETLEGIEPYCMALECWTPAEAKDKFLKRFIELTKEV